MIPAGHPVKGAKALVLGVTSKEDVPDVRNMRVRELALELKEHGVEVFGHNPVAEEKAVASLGLSPVPSPQEALKRLFLRLNAFVEEHGLGVVQVAPLPVRLWPGKIQEPDLFFVAKEHADRIGERVCGVPDLVVEVTSPSTTRTDRMEKYQECARAGVREYWIVNPEARTREVRVAEGGLHLAGQVGARRGGLLPGASGVRGEGGRGRGVVVT